ncbi:unnamed protein product [Ambrosiozyma monospora]|uniref:Unnamed protein product n=1 Tax=Ambrosiozyma monospora TaxID=43982 RepID=A0A9W6Z1J1_AMBMO|nr:unnamed protein product [Ambrosiozyma monospora]
MAQKTINEEDSTPVVVADYDLLHDKLTQGCVERVVKDIKRWFPEIVVQQTLELKPADYVKYYPTSPTSIIPLPHHPNFIESVVATQDSLLKNSVPYAQCGSCVTSKHLSPLWRGRVGLKSAQGYCGVLACLFFTFDFTSYNTLRVADVHNRKPEDGMVLADFVTRWIQDASIVSGESCSRAVIARLAHALPQYPNINLNQNQILKWAQGKSPRMNEFYTFIIANIPQHVTAVRSYHYLQNEKQETAEVKFNMADGDTGYEDYDEDVDCAAVADARSLRSRSKPHFNKQPRRVNQNKYNNCNKYNRDNNYSRDNNNKHKQYNSYSNYNRQQRYPVGKRQIRYFCKTCKCPQCIKNRESYYEARKRFSKSVSTMDNEEILWVNSLLAEDESMFGAVGSCPQTRELVEEVNSLLQQIPTDKDPLSEDDDEEDDSAFRNLADTLDDALSNISIVKRFTLPFFYRVKAATGDISHSNQVVTLSIHFDSSTTLVSDFIVLSDPSHDRIILGRPLLKKLRYSLSDDPDGEYITIAGETIFISSIKTTFICTKDETYAALLDPAHLSDYVNNSKSLIEYFANKHPLVFSGVTPKEFNHGFSYKVIIDQSFEYNRVAPYYTNGLSSKYIHDWIVESLKEGLIEPADDPTELVAAAPCFPIFHHGKVRVVLDLRNINKHLIYQNFPTPPFHIVIQKLAGFSYFSKLDLKSAYYHIPLSPDGDKLGVCTAEGTYRFNRLPFGLQSSNSVFDLFCKTVLKEILVDHDPNVYCYNFCDDLVLATKDAKTHIYWLKKIFATLDAKSLRVSVNKLSLLQTEFEFLGYLISKGKRYPSQSKIEAINKWKFPKTLKELKSFVGFVNFLSPFIPNCAAHLQHFYHLMKVSPAKIDENMVTPPLLKHFEYFKVSLKKSVGLKLFNPRSPTMIMTDASAYAAGGVILQKADDNRWYPLQFISRSFTPTQMRYSTLERELLAIVLALDNNYLLLTEDITVLSDHQALLTINNKSSKLSKRVLKFLETLTTYPLKLKYIKGELNVSDFLSRFHAMEQPSIDDSVFSTAQAIAVNALSPAMSIPALLNPTNASGGDDTDEEAGAGNGAGNGTGNAAGNDDGNAVGNDTGNDAHNAADDDDDADDDGADDNDEAASVNESSNGDNIQSSDRRIIRSVEGLSDSDLHQIIFLFHHNNTSIDEELEKFVDSFAINNGELKYIDQDTLFKVVSADQAMEFFTTTHNKYHCTPRLLLQLLKRQRWFIPNARYMALSVVRNCEKCDLYARFTSLPAPLQMIKLVPALSTWHLDFIGPLPQPHHNPDPELRSSSFVLHCVDYTTGFALGIISPTQNSAVVLKMIQMVLTFFPAIFML